MHMQIDRGCNLILSSMKGGGGLGIADIADKEGRGVRQIMTLADKRGSVTQLLTLAVRRGEDWGGQGNPEITDKKASRDKI